MYKSLKAQSLHYFSRPHRRPLRTPFPGPAAWRGSKLVTTPEQWCAELTEAEVDELLEAVRRAEGTGKPTRDLTAAEFPLPLLARRIGEWRREVGDGRGFQLIRGAPVDRWSQSQAEVFFWCFGLHLGTPGTQNPEGDLLGHVVDTGEDPAARTVRRYRTSANIAYHCDAADVVGLLCLRKAKTGGQSRIVSSVSVYNALLDARPDLVERLYEPFMLDAHGEGGLDYFPVSPCRYAGGRLRTFYHSDYFRSAMAYEDVPRFTKREQELVDLYEKIASSSELYLDMDLEPGDIQLVSNHTVLHARTGYEDFEQPEKKRHLLRLWLSLEEPMPLAERALRTASAAGFAAAFVRYRARRLKKGASARRAQVSS